MNRNRRKKVINILKQEKGQALLIVIILVALTGIIIAPLMSLMSSGLVQGTALERRSIQLTGAEAGINAACKFIKGPGLSVYVPEFVGEPKPTYTIHDFGQPGVTVEVTINLLTAFPDIRTYLVHSVCTTSSGSVSIDSNMKAEAGDYSYFLNNAFTTLGSIYLKNGVTINGFTQTGTPGDPFSFKEPVWGVNANPPPAYYQDRGIVAPGFPSAAILKAYYENLAYNLHPSGWVVPSGTHLTTTEYVIGNCEIVEIYLDGETLFVDGSFLNPPNKDVIIHGPGCVVATGNITFGPKMAVGGPGAGVLLVALGTADLSPSSDFYGWLAASIAILCKQGTDPTYNWVTPDLTLNFPGLQGSGSEGEGAGKLSVQTWDVTYA